MFVVDVEEEELEVHVEAPLVEHEEVDNAVHDEMGQVESKDTQD